MTESTKRYVNFNSIISVVRSLVGSFRFMGLIVLSLYMLMKNMLDVGSIAAILALQGNASSVFAAVGNSISSLQESLASVARVFAIFDMTSEFDNDKMGKCLSEEIHDDGDEAIKFENVSFNYSQTDKSKIENTISNMNLKIHRGETVAFVGPSGGGKSTVLKLLQRYYPIKGGDIIIEGKSLKDYDLVQLRDMMSYVPQDIYLFDDTIEENIRYGKYGASHEEIVEICRQLNIHDFIMEQPKGYNTVVGELGNKLSGGQKQRIALARALIKNAPILLLDESTSALDSETEMLIKDKINLLSKGCTKIIVAHRLTMAENADLIYVMDKGQVVEKGTHDQLMNKMGTYYKLYTLQFSNNMEQAVN